MVGAPGGLSLKDNPRSLALRGPYVLYAVQNKLHRKSGLSKLRPPPHLFSSNLTHGEENTFDNRKCECYILIINCFPQSPSSTSSFRIVSALNCTNPALALGRAITPQPWTAPSTATPPCKVQAMLSTVVW